MKQVVQNPLRVYRAGMKDVQESTQNKYVRPANSSGPNLLSLQPFEGVLAPQYSQQASKFHTQPQAQAQFHCYAASQSAVAYFQPDGTQILQTASPKIAVI